ncbi:MAG: translation elongation factor-like protein [Anaerolineales bacterium]|nr:translation elongation factor-like protein [Anaerolineales bacterium]
MANGEKIGEVSHYFGKISVAVLKLDKTLKVGDKVHFLGRNTDFPQEITSMQIEHEAITEAKKGDDVAVKVQQRVRRGDSVFRLTDED